MAGRIQPIAWAESAEDLYGRYRAERDVRRRTRLQVVWLVHRDRSFDSMGVGCGSRGAWLSKNTR
jgi:hypothetical protein